MYAIPLMEQSINSDSIELGVNVAKMLKVESGDYVELALENKSIILLSSINYDGAPCDVKVNSLTAELFNLGSRVVKISKCKYSKRRILERVKVKLLNHETLSLPLLAYIKLSLVGKPGKENTMIPINTPNGTMIVHILETQPRNKPGLIGSSTIIEF